MGKKFRELVSSSKCLPAPVRYDEEEADQIDCPEDLTDEDEYPSLNRTTAGFSNFKSRKDRVSMWAKEGFNFWPCENTADSLPCGQYQVYKSQRGIYFSLTRVELDEIIQLPDSATEEVLNNIKNFWSKEKEFREHGFLWKRGILLYGPPGGGKTSTVNLLSKNIIDKGGSTIYVSNPSVVAEGLEIFRRIEPDRPIVVILEDLDGIAMEYGEGELLSLLDGELQIDNVVFIATTNYPEKLDKRIINRPSRFDFVKKIGMPTREARKVFLESKGINEKKVEKYLEVSEDFSIAHLKELIISVEIMGNGLEETVKRLRRMIDYHPKSDDDIEKGVFGFTDTD